MQESERFSSKKCPVGCLAHHAKHGLVEVIGMSGLAREIKFEALNDETLEPVTIIDLVHVTELREENLLQALGLDESSQHCDIEQMLPGLYVTFDK